MRSIPSQFTVASCFFLMEFRLLRHPRTVYLTQCTLELFDSTLTICEGKVAPRYIFSTQLLLDTRERASPNVPISLKLLRLVNGPPNARRCELTREADRSVSMADARPCPSGVLEHKSSKWRNNK